MKRILATLLSYSGKGYMRFEGFLLSNKDFIQITVAVIIGVASLIISRNSEKNSSVELKIREMELKPTFKMTLVAIDTAKSPEFELDFNKEKGYAKDMKSSINSFFIISQSEGDEMPEPCCSSQKEVFAVSFFQLYKNEMAKTGTISFFAKPDTSKIDFWGKLNYKGDFFVQQKHVLTKSGIKYNYRIDLIHFLVIQYLDISNKVQERYFEVTDGGVEVSKEKLTEFFLDYRKPPFKLYSLVAFNLSNIDTLMYTLRPIEKPHTNETIGEESE